MTEESVSVYNFQVDNFHTYFVGDCEVWVHNVDCMPTEKQKGFVNSKENSDCSITVSESESYTQNICAERFFHKICFL